MFNPPFFNDLYSHSTLYYENTILRWIIFFALVMLSFGIGKIISWFLHSVLKKFIIKTKTKTDDILLHSASNPLVFIIILIGIRASLSVLTIPPTPMVIVRDTYLLSIIFCIAWLINRLFSTLIITFINPIVEKSETHIDDLLLPFLSKTISFIIWSLAFMIWLHNIGYDVSAVLASLGIGGLAIALAAKDTLSNLIAAFTIFIDHPFIVGDIITVNGRDAVVKEIGMRSTRLEIMFSRQILIVPNSDLINNQVINISAEPSHLFMLHFPLSFDTTAETIKMAMGMVKEEIIKHQYTENKPDVWFGLVASVKTIHVRVWIKPEAFQTSDYDTVLSEINLSILTNFEKQGVFIGFPPPQMFTQVETKK